MTGPDTTNAASFKFSYGALRPLLSSLGMGPRFSTIELDDETLRVHMGWAFRAEIPVHNITAVQPREGFPGGIGVHGWRGRWLVNGSTTGLLALTIDPPVRAWATGIPVRLRQLVVSLEDPGAVVAALGR